MLKILLNEGEFNSEREDKHHFLNLQEGRTLLWILLQVCYLWAGNAMDYHIDLSDLPCGCMEDWTAICHYHTALCITDRSQICLSVHVVKSTQLNSWATLSVHGVSIFSLKQVWDHSSQIFFPWWAKLSYIVFPFPQAKSTVGDSHHSIAGT